MYYRARFKEVSMIKSFLAAAAVLSTLSLFAVPAQVIIIRHGEKPEVGNTLSAKGEERAGALPVFFQTNPLVLDFGFPVAIFTFRPRIGGNTSIRGIETITPTAESFGFPVHSPYTVTETTQVAQLILNESMYDGKMVLMCWEHNNMKNLVTALGAPTPPDYPDDRFDLVYKVTYTDPSRPTFCCGLEKLMFDDKDLVPLDFFSLACP